jgi:hypothetical protein
MADQSKNIKSISKKVIDTLPLAVINKQKTPGAEKKRYGIPFAM